jgi:hypothetical protein
MKFLTLHPAANSFFVTTRSTTPAEVLGSGDKKEKVQKATQGVESKRDWVPQLLLASQRRDFGHMKTILVI